MKTFWVVRPKSALCSYFCRTFYRRYLTVFWLCLGFKIYQYSEYASSSKHARILNITFPKYRENFFIENIRKIRFLKNRKVFLKNFFRVITFRKKYKKFFREKFWGLSPGSGLGSVIIHYYQKFHVICSMLEYVLRNWGIEEYVYFM